MNSVLKIPYGVTDFAKMRTEGYYYVDKTRFIPMLEREGNYVFFLRPRRFGKSLMMNVIQAYYDVQYAGQFETLFEGLDVGKNPTEKHNNYLVLKFNFSGVNPDREEVEASFNNKVLTTLQAFVENYAEYYPADTLSELRRYTACDQAMNYVMTRTKLARQRIYLLIDEYDNFANTLMTKDENGYTTLTHGAGAFRLFFNILKEATTDNNAAIDRMFITGVTPLTLSDVTSGFNIGDNFSLNPNFNEAVGFTEDEVRTMLCYYRDATGAFHHTIDELIEAMKPWYNNNCFAIDCLDKARMFNSDMTLFFIKEYVRRGGKIPQEMIDFNVRSDYNKMRKMVKIDQTFGTKGRIMQSIFESRSSMARVRPEFSLHELQSPENLPSLLFYMGLLTYGVDADGYPCLVIPNQVVFEQYYRYMESCYERFMNWYTDNDQMYELGMKLVRKGDALPLLQYICQQVTTDSSNRDFDAQAESFVKGFFLAKMGGTNNAYLLIETETEENHGYSDLYLEPWNDDCRHSFHIELKYCKHGATDAELAQKHQEAIAQLTRYSADKALQQRAASHGWTHHQYVIVFRGWTCEICEERI